MEAGISEQVDNMVTNYFIILVESKHIIGRLDDFELKL